MNSNFQTLTTERLRKLVVESEQTLVDLKAELDVREQISQSQEVANLEHHMQSAELSLKTDLPLVNNEIDLYLYTF